MGFFFTWHLLEKLLKIIPDSRGRRPIGACYLAFTTVALGINCSCSRIHRDAIIITGMGISSRPPKGRNNVVLDIVVLIIPGHPAHP